MLQVVVRSRALFIISTIVIWALIFTVPMIGEYYRKSTKTGLSAKSNDPLEHLSEDSSKINPKDIIGEDRIDFLHAGEFQQKSMCIDTLDGSIGGTLGIWECHGAGRNQFWYIMKGSHALKNVDLCVEGPDDLKTKSQLFLKACNGNENQAWAYENEQLKLSGSKLCIEANLIKKHLYLNECDVSNDAQKWTKKTPPGF